jgi:hypothetical protein
MLNFELCGFDGVLPVELLKQVNQFDRVVWVEHQFCKDERVVQADRQKNL